MAKVFLFKPGKMNDHYPDYQVVVDGDKITCTCIGYLRKARCRHTGEIIESIKYIKGLDVESRERLRQCIVSNEWEEISKELWPRANPLQLKQLISFIRHGFELTEE